MGSNRLFPALSASTSRLCPVTLKRGKRGNRTWIPPGSASSFHSNDLRITSPLQAFSVFATSNCLCRERLFWQRGEPFPEISQNKEKMVDIQKVTCGMEKTVVKLESYPYKLGKQPDFFLQVYTVHP